MKRFGKYRALELLFITLLILTLSIRSIGSKSMSFNNVNLLKTLEVETGSFSITNTTESRYLFEDYIWGVNIGATWNLTIHVNANSTSAINFLLIEYSNWWEGIRDFRIHPGQTFTNNYTQHGVSDDMPYFYFNYSLEESMKNASGTYHFTLVHPGYHSVFGTGSLYVHNITAWLSKKESSTSSSDVSFSTSFVEFGVLFGIYGFVFSRKKKRE
ncbi:MAG: hypothetical protein ACW97X_13150 [Candidatus Hodarchaeales archaeon]|jgi:hypothetical protein